MAKKRPAAADPPFISLTQQERALLEERAAGRVRTILLGIAELTPAEGDHLCHWLQYYLPLNWRLMPASEADRLELDWQRAAKAARYFAGKVRMEDEDAVRNAKIIKSWNGGPKVKGGKGPEGVRLDLEAEYPGLTTGAIKQVIHRYRMKQAERRAAGLL